MMKVQAGEQLCRVFQLHFVRTLSVYSALPSFLRLPVTLLINTCYLTPGNVMERHSSELSQGHSQSYQVCTQHH